MVNVKLTQRTDLLRGLLIVVLIMFVGPSAFANEVSVLAAKLRLTNNQSAGSSTWNANVTLKHADSGWEHYADVWRVVDAKGNVFGTRTLFHPHETEQPFTRSLSGIKVPEGVTVIFIEAHDKVHGWSKQRLQVDLSKAKKGRVQARR